MPFYQTLKTFARLSRAEQRLGLVSGLLTVGTRLLLRLRPFRSVLAWARRLAARPPLAPAHRLPAAVITGIVQRTGRHLADPDGPCLTQALVLFVLFRRHGHPATLHIGVVKGGEREFQAHAWVESQGRVVIGGVPDLARYTPLPPLSL